MSNRDLVLELLARKQILLVLRRALDKAERESQQLTHTRPPDHNNAMFRAYRWARREFIGGELRRLDEQERDAERE